ncbi:hypothetical protein GF378_01440 [Candidatus Pacearchaeota archaeon]|nr:hypothetical protein [Candidatus Pacearchaeota archaeon]
MMGEELTLGVKKENAYFSLSDNEGEIGSVRLEYMDEKARTILDPQFLVDHKEVRIKYNLYPHARRREIGDYERFLKMSEKADYRDVPEINLGEIDRQTQMSFKLDLTSLNDFIEEMGAEKRMSLRGIPGGEFGQFWVLNLRILNPSQVKLFS